MSGRRRRGRAAVAAAGALLAALAAAGPVLLPAHAFGRPSGPHGVGTLTYHWVDPTRPEVLRPGSTAHREVVAQVWYPAAPAPGAPTVPYVPDADAVIAAMARQHGMPRAVFHGLRTARVHAVEAAAPAPGTARWPVLVFLEGLTGFRQMNTFQVEHLVSHGYAVVALDQPDVAAEVVLPGGRRTGSLPARQLQALVEPAFNPVDAAPRLDGRPFPDGVLAHLAADVGFALDRIADLDAADPRGPLTGRLDLSRTGLFGVSMGGIVGAEACRTQRRLRACLLLDAPMPAAVVRDGPPQATMWITRDAATMHREGWADRDVEEHQQTMERAFGAARDAAYLVRVPGAYHADFTDLVDVLPVIGIAGYGGPIGNARAHRAINDHALAFFDRHLRGLPAALLDPANPPDPPITVESRGPGRREQGPR